MTDDSFEEMVRRVFAWQEASARWHKRHPREQMIAEANLLMAEALGLIEHHGGKREHLQTAFPQVHAG
jgi:hypothetical protein